MKLIHKATGIEVKIGDRVKDFRGEDMTITYFQPPHKPSSQGLVSVQTSGFKTSHELYCSVVDTEWIDREDRV
jgi:hypothetical protein